MDIAAKFDFSANSVRFAVTHDAALASHAVVLVNGAGIPVCEGVDLTAVTASVRYVGSGDLRAVMRADVDYAGNAYSEGTGGADPGVVIQPTYATLTTFLTHLRNAHLLADVYAGKTIRIERGHSVYRTTVRATSTGDTVELTLDPASCTTPSGIAAADFVGGRLTFPVAHPDLWFEVLTVTSGATPNVTIRGTLPASVAAGTVAHITTAARAIEDVAESGGSQKFVTDDQVHSRITTLPALRDNVNSDFMGTDGTFAFTSGESPVSSGIYHLHAAAEGAGITGTQSGNYHAGHTGTWTPGVGQPDASALSTFRLHVPKSLIPAGEAIAVGDTIEFVSEDTGAGATDTFQRVQGVVAAVTDGGDDWDVQFSYVTCAAANPYPPNATYRVWAWHPSNRAVIENLLRPGERLTAVVYNRSTEAVVGMAPVTVPEAVLEFDFNELASLGTVDNNEALSRAHMVVGPLCIGGEVVDSPLMRLSGTLKTVNQAAVGTFPGIGTATGAFTIDSNQVLFDASQSNDPVTDNGGSHFKDGRFVVVLADNFAGGDLLELDVTLTTGALTFHKTVSVAVQPAV